MPKIVTDNAKGVLIKFILKSIFYCILSVLILSSLFSLLIYKVDLPVEYVKYFSYIIIAASTFAVSQTALIGCRHSLFPLSLLSSAPIIILVILNFAFHSRDFIDSIIKIILIVLFCLISAIIKSKRKR